MLVSTTNTTVDHSVDWPVLKKNACTENLKIAHHSFSEPKVTYSDVLFYPTNSPKWKKKDIEFIIIEEGNTETVKLYLKNGLLKIVKCKFSINSQIN